MDSNMLNFDLIETDNPYRHLLWKRGFFASCFAKPPTIHHHWKTWSFKTFNISYDPVQPFSTQINQEGFLCLLGHLVSLNCEVTDHQKITNYIFTKLAQSLDDFFDELDNCCGRFICFYSLGDAVHVLNDATGMKSVYYASSPYPAVASHSFILHNYLEKEPSKECKNFLDNAKPKTYNMSFLPGHASIYDDIRVLVPNNQLNLKSGKLYRYFPRQELHPLSSIGVVDTASRYFTELMEKFNRISPLHVSLSAGLDSRLTTAATRNIQDQLTYFTYVRKGEKVNYVDAIIAERLSERHNLKHENHFFNYEITKSEHEDSNYSLFKRIVNKCIDFEHFIPLAYDYYKTYPENRLHVRSNIGKICRARYYKPTFDQITNKNNSYLTKLVKIYNRWTNAVDHLFSYKEFERYIAETNLFNQTHGYDLPSLYYWEHLMPTWHGSLLLESDISHDTVCLYNCRSVLCTFLAAPFEDQISSNSMLNVIRNLWPELLDEPINPPYPTLPLTTVNRFLKNNHLDTTPLVVHTHRHDDVLEAQCEISDDYFTGEVEYAFYFIVNGNRRDTKWYTPENKTSFELNDETRNANLEVRGFVRERQNPNNKISKLVSA